MSDGDTGSNGTLLQADRLSGLSVASALILAIRLSRGWTQVRLARKLGVNRTTIWRWETGATEPNVRDLMLFRAMLRATKSPVAVATGLSGGTAET